MDGIPAQAARDAQKKYERLEALAAHADEDWGEAVLALARRR